MKLFIWSLFVTYLVGFSFVFSMEVTAGPVTPTLSFVRAAIWPFYLATGKPMGRRIQIGDGDD